MKTLIITEKPDVARDVRKAIEPMAVSKEGYFQGSRYIITWAFGHMVQLAPPEAYVKTTKKYWTMDELPFIPDKFKLTLNKSTTKQFNVIKELKAGGLAGPIDQIINCCDADREGELIFRLIMEKAGKNNADVYRVWLNDQTEEGIKKAFQKMKPSAMYDGLADAARCRAESDWLIGINATRAVTVKNRKLYSIGRVQTPTLAIIVDREEQIMNFSSHRFWEIEAEFGTANGNFFIGKFLNESGYRITDQNLADEVFTKTMGKEGVIERIIISKETVPAPHPYNLTDLQIDANSKYSFTAQQTLQIAQDLYEKKKMITYPRTDSRYLTEDLVAEARPIIKAISQIEKFKTYTDMILAQDPEVIGKLIGPKSSHHAIIPTLNIAAYESLKSEEKNIYLLIVKRFIAALYPAYTYEKKEVYTRIQEEDYLFKSIGNRPLELGWKCIYKESGENQGDTESQALPELKEGEKAQVTKVELITKKTEPPKRYTDATLLKAMESAAKFVDDKEIREAMKVNGLGTQSTRAKIIERLLEVGYIDRINKNLLPTQKGFDLLKIVQLPEIKSPAWTGEWEARLHLIEEGQEDSKKFMSDIKVYTKEMVKLLS